MPLTDSAPASYESNKILSVSVFAPVTAIEPAGQPVPAKLIGLLKKTADALAVEAIDKLNNAVFAIADKIFIVYSLRIVCSNSKFAGFALVISLLASL